ncbi:hypothetical protein [Cryobacterium sp. PH31-O1]|uniref:hypothetical protein n=1 Tax=Cryobacterium sp. PH31-O1 TaxID=3046306 RepID=UPI0024BAF3D3|nr:hypothetical protein [Cryobacterium sp. PH31-O1]MDJ0338241.1 hypothetical protein [Cryobacterium sp. PH31-O1]
MRLLVIGPAALAPDASGDAARERALFAQLDDDAFAAPSQAACRENLIELVARAASAGIRVVIVTDQAGPVDLRLDNIDVGPLVTAHLEVVRPRNARVGEFWNFRRRLLALRGYIAERDNRIVSRVVFVDSGVKDEAGRNLSSKFLVNLGLDAELVDPGPWGLALGSYAQICAALELDVPSPRPTTSRASNNDEELF